MAIDPLSDALWNLVTAARKDPEHRDALMGRALALIADLEEEARRSSGVTPTGGAEPC